ncbi:unnamed protein product [Linum tenue]|uniref:Uncharacterized protein n=1 Tax=Linum tenue TaxID=586396 RepID=A0AAV0RAM1_9ROSI|nr:unnamed protein product [Linum tenue]
MAADLADAEATEVDYKEAEEATVKLLRPSLPAKLPLESATAPPFVCFLSSFVAPSQLAHRFGWLDSDLGADLASRTIAAKMKLKLVVDKKRNKVIFAEAQKDFVDLLIYILSLPLSAVVKYLDAAGPSSLVKLHSSVESMREAGARRKLYNCKNGHRHVVDRVHESNWCDYCNEGMGEEVVLVEREMEADYVKEMVSYMVADDLTVSPLDYNSVFAAMDGFDRADVVEKEVQIGSDEQALALLNAALHSKEPLTSVFLKTEAAPTPSREK